jgi:hypothetical protein
MGSIVGGSVFAVVVVLVAACGSTKPVEFADAASDSVYCPSMTVFTPVTVSGRSPQGSLDEFHYASAGFVTGFCPNAYVIDFTPQQLDPTCTVAPWFQLEVLAPFMSTGTNRAAATLSAERNSYTQQVTFEATQLDTPDAMPPHIVGHFVSYDPAWSFDIAVDITSQFSDDCI